MPEHRLLKPEVLSHRTYARARRRSLLAASAVGGLLGSAAMVAFAYGVAFSIPSVSLPAVSESMDLPEPVASAALSVPAPIAAKAEKAATGQPAAIVMADAPRLVIAPTAWDGWLVPGAPDLLEGDDDSIHYVLEKDVHTHNLPAEIRALVGKPVSLFDDSGARCSAIVGSLSALRVVYSDRDDEMTDAAREEAWGWGTPALVAEIASISEGCPGTIAGGVIGATNVDGAGVKNLESGDSLAAAAIAAWEKSSGHKQAQREFDAADTSNTNRTNGKWSDLGAPTVTLVGGPERGVAIVTLDVGGCGEFEATVTSAFRVKDGAVGAALEIPSDMVIGIGAAAYANGDELPEIFFEGSWGSRGVLVSGGDVYESVEGEETSWHHCPC